jgi:hypothetical protein
VRFLTGKSACSAGPATITFKSTLFSRLQIKMREKSYYENRVSIWNKGKGQDSREKIRTTADKYDLFHTAGNDTI